MTFQIAICDDEPVQIEYLSSLVTKWAHTAGHSCNVHAFPCAEAFLFAHEGGNPFDILLLDIEMGAISGIDLAKRIREKGSRAEIIFTTSHFEFVSEGYEVDALHYLTKPIAEEKLGSVLEKAAGRLALTPPCVIIVCEGETIKLPESDILYAEAFLHYLCVYTDKGEYRIKESLSAFEAKLGDGFFRIHRSYLVSLRHITKISRTAVIIDGKRELPLARGKYDMVNRAFIEYM